MNYEEKLKKIEGLIENLNNPQNTMKKSCEDFETAVNLLKECNKELKENSGKMTVLKEELGSLNEEEEWEYQNYLAKEWKKRQQE